MLVTHADAQTATIHEPLHGHHLPVRTVAARLDQTHDTTTHTADADAKANKRQATQPHHHLPILAATDWLKQSHAISKKASHEEEQNKTRHATQHYHQPPTLAAAAKHDLPPDTQTQTTHRNVEVQSDNIPSKGKESDSQYSSHMVPLKINRLGTVRARATHCNKPDTRTPNMSMIAYVPPAKKNATRKLWQATRQAKAEILASRSAGRRRLGGTEELEEDSYDMNKQHIPVGTIPATRILVGKPGLGMQEIQMPNGPAPAVDPFAFDKFTAPAAADQPDRPSTLDVIQPALMPPVMPCSPITNGLDSSLIPGAPIVVKLGGHILQVLTTRPIPKCPLADRQQDRHQPPGHAHIETRQRDHNMIEVPHATQAKKGEVTYLPQTPPHNPVDSVTAQYLEMVAVHAPALQVEEILPSRYTVQPESGTALQAFSLALVCTTRVGHSHASALQQAVALGSRADFLTRWENGGFSYGCKATCIVQGANSRLTQDNNSIQGSVRIIAEQGWEALGIPAEPTAPLEERVTSLLHILGAHAVKAQVGALPSLPLPTLPNPDQECQDSWSRYLAKAAAAAASAESMAVQCMHKGKQIYSITSNSPAVAQACAKQPDHTLTLPVCFECTGHALIWVLPPKATAQAYSINVDGFSDPLFKTQPATMMAILTAFEAQLRIGLESVVRKAMEAASSSSSSGSMGASGSALRAAGQHAIRVGCATTVDRMVQSVHFQHITGKRVPLQEAKLDPLAVACSATGRPLFLSTPQQMRDEHVARHSQAQILLGDNHSVVLTALGLATAPPLAVGTMSLRLSAGKRPEYPTPPLTAAQASYTLIAAGIASLSTDFNPLGKPLPTLTSLPPLDKTTARASMAVLAVEAFAAHLEAGAKPLREAMPAEEQEDSLENLLDGLESISAEQVTASLIPQAGSHASVGPHAGTNKGKGPLQATGPQRPAPPPQAPASPEEVPVNPFTAALQANKATKRKANEGPGSVEDQEYDPLAHPGRTWRSVSGQQLTKHAHANRRLGKAPARRKADSGGYARTASTALVDSDHTRGRRSTSINHMRALQPSLVTARHGTIQDSHTRSIAPQGHRETCNCWYHISTDLHLRGKHCNVQSGPPHYADTIHEKTGTTRQPSIPTLHHHLPALAAAAWHDQPYDTVKLATHADAQAANRHAPQHCHNLPAMIATHWHELTSHTTMQTADADAQAAQRHATQLHHHLSVLAVATWHEQPYDTAMLATHADAQKPYNHLQSLTTTTYKALPSPPAKPYHHLPALTVIPNTL
ncbi:hypothetical protein QJQ45_015070, partial [Haematococcus lacustris]